MLYALIRPFLFALSAETAHRLVLWSMSLASRFAPLRAFLRALYQPTPRPRLRTRCFGLEFENPIGLAAGLDKDAEAVPGFEALGFGFVEVGTVTPRPQPGNPKPRLFRLKPDRALINRMGFNNHGAEEMEQQLARAAPHRQRDRRMLGVNLGKNKDTPLEQAPADYLASFRKLYERGDYFVVNVSSPNTPGLRSLQSVEALSAIVKPLLEERSSHSIRKPVLVKLAPDLALEDALEIARACESLGVDGLIIGNTTLDRSGLVSAKELVEQSGGLSGAPLRSRSTMMLRAVAANTRLPIIGVGGILGAADAYEKIRAGASLVQVYTGFIYQGPSLLSRMVRELDELLARDGFASVADAVGADLRPHPSPATSVAVNSSSPLDSSLVAISPRA
jgi:dihydroorotate dehydrogenase